MGSGSREGEEKFPSKKINGIRGKDTAKRLQSQGGAGGKSPFLLSGQRVIGASSRVVTGGKKKTSELCLKKEKSRKFLRAWNRRTGNREPGAGGGDYLSLGICFVWKSGEKEVVDYCTGLEGNGLPAFTKVNCLKTA